MGGTTQKRLSFAVSSKHVRRKVWVTTVLLLTFNLSAWHSIVVKQVDVILENQSFPKLARNQNASVTLQNGIRGRNDILSTILLCRPESIVFALNTDAPAANSLTNWTVEQCVVDHDDENGLNPHVDSAFYLMAKESQWVSCAKNVNSSALYLSHQVDIIPAELTCPSYPEPPLFNNNMTVFLSVPMGFRSNNIFHVLVMEKRGGLALWCVLDAANRFAHSAARTKTSWRLDSAPEFPKKHQSNYIRELFQLLSSSNETSGDGSKNDTVSEKIPYELEGVRQWREKLSIPLSDSVAFFPNTRKSQFLVDVAERVRELALASRMTAKEQSAPYILLILRSTLHRRLAGAKTGTATEIVLALLNKSLPVHIVDLAYATVAEQIQLFWDATVVIGMHGAGLTNLVWMKHGGSSAVIEVAASYGWAHYIDKEGNCTRKENEPVKYKKGDFYNLAQRFDIKHFLFHPMYASRPPDEPVNPMRKSVYYVDADDLAATAELAFWESLQHQSNLSGVS